MFWGVPPFKEIPKLPWFNLRCFQDFFCSQLVAEALKVMGVLPRGEGPSCRRTGGKVVTKFCSPPVRWGLLDFMSVSSPPPPPVLLLVLLPRPPPVAILWVQCGVPDLNRDPVSSVWRAGPQPRSCEFSVACRTPAAILWVQCGVPDLNRDPVSSVWRAGPQVMCQKICQKEWQKLCQKECQKICQKKCQKDMSEDMSERMSRDMSERCQKECQNICQKECQKICQKECQKICQE